MMQGLNREQRLAADCLDRPVLVTAGAGSGKTRMLAHRFANAIIPGVVDGWRSADVDEVLAITFTDKAAGEIGERVRLELLAAGREEEARLVRDAWISTIHGLCSRLLRRHPVEAGVDPLFVVADTAQLGRLREEAFERVARAVVATEDEGVRLFDTYGYESLFSACVAISRTLAVFGRTSDDVRLEPAEDAARLLTETERLFRRGRTSCELGYSGTSSDPLDHVERCEGLLERCEGLRRSGGDETWLLDELLNVLDEYRPLKRLKGLEVEAADLAVAKKDLSGRVAASFVAPNARTLRRLAGDFSAAYAELKSMAGLLDFDDLQVKAVELLERRPDLARRYQKQFRVVMVDEFQDTDALQLRLVEALSDGDLCTVGDEKQSIYRFRGADVDVYRVHRQDMEARGALIAELAVNYRSHPDVLGFVNAVFGSDEYFGAGTGGLLRLVAPETRTTGFDDAVFLSGPRVEALFVDSTEAEGSARATEASQVAKRVRQLCNAGVGARDVAILMRTYSHAHVYAEALSQEGIRAVVVGGSRFFGLPEIAVMRALNRLVANVGDEIALGVLLASDFVPISSDALAVLRLGSGERDRRPLWTLLCERTDALADEDRQVAERLVWVLERARDRVGAMPLAEVLLLAVEEAGWDLRLLSKGNSGRDAFANVLKFARQAADFERTVGTGPAGFARHLDTKERLGDTEAPATLVDDDSDAVRIMSVHASKGLEFPIVVVPELAAQGTRDSATVRIAREGDSLALALKTQASDEGKSRPSSALFSEFSEADRQADDEERARILYVAFTRAREALLMSGSMKMRPKSPSKATNDLARLARILGIEIPVAGASDEVISVRDSSVRCRVRVVEAVESDGFGRIGEPSSDAPLLHPCPGAVAEEAPRASAPERMSYTQLSEFEQCPRRFWIRRVLGVRAVESGHAGETDPLRFGTALHAALSLVTTEGEPPPNERMEAIGRYFEFPADRAERLDRAVRRYCASDVAQRAEAGEIVRRESPFAMRIQDRFLLTGSIDLYSRTGDSAFVVDYKSGAESDLLDLAQRYRLQAECYALAVLRDGCKSVVVEFVRPEADDTTTGAMQQVGFSFDAEDAAQIEADLLRRYDAIQGSAFEPLPSSHCVHCDVPGALCSSAAGAARRAGRG